MCEIHELWSVHAYGQVSDEILNEREREYDWSLACAFHVLTNSNFGHQDTSPRSG